MYTSKCINASLIYGSLAAVIYLLKQACSSINYLHICVVPMMLHQSEACRAGLQRSPLLSMGLP